VELTLNSAKHVLGVPLAALVLELVLLATLSRWIPIRAGYHPWMDS